LLLYFKSVSYTYNRLELCHIALSLLSALLFEPLWQFDNIVVVSDGN